MHRGMDLENRCGIKRFEFEQTIVRLSMRQSRRLFRLMTNADDCVEAERLRLFHRPNAKRRRSLSD